MSAADPVGDEAAVFVRCLLPREVTGVKGMDLAVREEVVEILVVRPRHEVIVAPGHDLGRRGDRRQQIAQDRVLFGVVPHEPGRLREPPEVVGADIVLVDLGLAVASQGRVVATGTANSNRYISVLSIVDRKIAHWRDYLDPLAVFDAVGWPAAAADSD